MLQFYVTDMISPYCPICRRFGALIPMPEIIPRFGIDAELSAVSDRLLCRSCGARAQISLVWDPRWNRPEEMIQRYGRDHLWRPWPIVRIEPE